MKNINTDKDLSSVIFETGVLDLRDPFILLEDGVYYMYGTCWICYRSENLTGPWEGPFNVAEIPANAVKDHWAPEVHKYNGAYYMFTTYFSSETNHRGCSIFKASSPMGPFVEISDGHVTPKEWDAIDGTLYVDEKGQPYMVFVHEWTSMPDKIGSFAVAKLSDDLSHFISEPVELFKAKDTKWAKGGITDGCFIYKCKDGSLLMLWSNFSETGYVTAIAKSESGNIEGPWTHAEELLYEKCDVRPYDVGHGMILTAKDGNMYLSIHSPNTPTAEKRTSDILIKVKEENGLLKWDI
jgi:beta-xylosidase